MNYKELTIYNYRISYYLIRVFAIFWLFKLYSNFLRFSERPAEFYKPTYWLQEILFPIFPSNTYFLGLIIPTAIFIVLSSIKPKVIFNFLIFILLAILNMPIAAYHGAGHHNHLFILSFFFSVFLIPNKLKKEDFRYVQYFYVGLLMTYTFAGFWKFVSIAKDIVINSPDISWLEPNAAKLNTFVNWHFTDQFPPEYMVMVYEFVYLWIVITFLGILAQTLSVFGAFNRKYLTFTMIFLVLFHLYNKYFVIADFSTAIIVVVILFFPYHHLRQINFIFKKTFVKT